MPIYYQFSNKTRPISKTCDLKKESETKTCVWNEWNNEMVEYKLYLNDKITFATKLHKIILHKFFLYFYKLVQL